MDQESSTVGACAGAQDPAGSLMMPSSSQRPAPGQTQLPRQQQPGLGAQQQMHKPLGGSGSLSGGLLGEFPTARGPMAARGTAAVETAQPKKDPFADLLG